MANIFENIKNVFANIKNRLMGEKKGNGLEEAKDPYDKLVYIFGEKRRIELDDIDRIKKLCVDITCDEAKSTIERKFEGLKSVYLEKNVNLEFKNEQRVDRDVNYKKTEDYKNFIKNEYQNLVSKEKKKAKMTEKSKKRRKEEKYSYAYENEISWGYLSPKHKVAYQVNSRKMVDWILENDTNAKGSTIFLGDVPAEEESEYFSEKSNKKWLKKKSKCSLPFIYCSLSSEDTNCRKCILYQINVERQNDNLLQYKREVDEEYFFKEDMKSRWLPDVPYADDLISHTLITNEDAVWRRFLLYEDFKFSKLTTEEKDLFISALRKRNLYAMGGFKVEEDREINERSRKKFEKIELFNFEKEIDSVVERGALKDAIKKKELENHSNEEDNHGNKEDNHSNEEDNHDINVDADNDRTLPDESSECISFVVMDDPKSKYHPRIMPAIEQARKEYEKKYGPIKEEEVTSPYDLKYYKPSDDDRVYSVVQEDIPLKHKNWIENLKQAIDKSSEIKEGAEALTTSEKDSKSTDGELGKPPESNAYEDQQVLTESVSSGEGYDVKDAPVNNSNLFNNVREKEGSAYQKDNDTNNGYDHKFTNGQTLLDESAVDKNLRSEKLHIFSQNENKNDMPLTSNTNDQQPPDKNVFTFNSKFNDSLKPTVDVKFNPSQDHNQNFRNKNIFQGSSLQNNFQPGLASNSNEFSLCQKPPNESNKAGLEGLSEALRPQKRSLNSEYDYKRASPSNILSPSPSNEIRSPNLGNYNNSYEQDQSSESNFYNPQQGNNVNIFAPQNSSSFSNPQNVNTLSSQFSNTSKSGNLNIGSTNSFGSSPNLNLGIFNNNQAPSSVFNSNQPLDSQNYKNNIGNMYNQLSFDNRTQNDNSLTTALHFNPNSQDNSRHKITDNIESIKCPFLPKDEAILSKKPENISPFYSMDFRPEIQNHPEMQKLQEIHARRSERTTPNSQIYNPVFEPVRFPPLDYDEKLAFVDNTFRFEDVFNKSNPDLFSNKKSIFDDIIFEDKDNSNGESHIKYMDDGDNKKSNGSLFDFFNDASKK